MDDDGEADSVTGWLPAEVLVCVLDRLSLGDLLRCSLVCRRWAMLVAENSLWKRHFVAYWGEGAAYCKEDDLPWRDYFRLLYCPQKIDPARVLLQRFIGPGPCKSAHAALYQPPDLNLRPLPVVLLNFGNYYVRHSLDKITYEIDLLRRLKHPRICRLIGISEESTYFRTEDGKELKSQVSLLVERCDCNLTYFLSSRYQIYRAHPNPEDEEARQELAQRLIGEGRYVPVNLTPTVVTRWLLDVAEALHYLHMLEPPVIFHNVTFSKVYIDADSLRCKLGGFTEATTAERAIIDPITGERDHVQPSQDIFMFGNLIDGFTGDPVFKHMTGPWLDALNALFKRLRSRDIKDSVALLDALWDLDEVARTTVLTLKPKEERT